LIKRERGLPWWEIVVCCSGVAEQGRYTYVIAVREEKTYMHEGREINSSAFK
jgi:hypothetical protein